MVSLLLHNETGDDLISHLPFSFELSLFTVRHAGRRIGQPPRCRQNRCVMPATPRICFEPSAADTPGQLMFAMPLFFM